MKLTLDGKQVSSAEFGEGTLSELIRNLSRKSLRRELLSQ